MIICVRVTGEKKGGSEAKQIANIKSDITQYEGSELYRYWLTVI